MKKISEVIKDLVILLDKNKLHIKYPWKNTSKYQKYFNVVASSSYQSMDHLAQLLGYEDKNDKSFARFQQRLENKLSQLLFSIDLEFENRNKNAQNGHNVVLYYSQGKMLLQRSMRPAAMYYLRKAMNLAKKTSLTEYEYLVNYEFYKYYSTVDYNKKKKEHFFEQLSHSKELMFAELEVKGYESDLVALVSKNVDRKILIEKAKYFNYKSDLLTKQLFSYSLNMTAFQIQVFYYNLVKDYERIFKEVEKYRALLIEHNVLYEGSAYLINTAHLNALISSCRFEESKAFIEENKEFYKKGSHSYFSRMNQYFKVLMRLKKYETVMQLTDEIFSQKSIDLFSRFNELWLIKKGYMHLIMEFGLVSNSDTSFGVISNYKLNKLLNQISIYSKDKTGQNAGLRILEMCFFIVRKSEGQLIDKIESVRQYAYRYLRNDDDLRFKIFFRFLISCYEQNYNVTAIRRHTEDLFQKLLLNPQELTDSIVEAEVIPFEDLWIYLLDFIESNYSQRA